MKAKIFLIGSLLVNSLMSAQVPYPHISTSNGSAERGAKFGASDVTNDFLEITNSTADAGKYLPSIWAHQQSDNRYALMMFGTTNSTKDNGTSPIMVFRSELRNSLNLTAPNGTSSFPWGASGTSVLNRPLFSWQNGSSIKMLMSANGNLGIGTTTPDQKLSVNGMIHAKEIIVDLIGWPDYVFEEDYELMPLEKLEKKIKEDKHLPEIPSAKEIENNGVLLGEMNKKLLQKIEELTLYIIQQNKDIELLKTQTKKISDLEAKINELIAKQ
jgi:hypothetical protein